MPDLPVSRPEESPHSTRPAATRPPPAAPPAPAGCDGRATAAVVAEECPSCGLALRLWAGFYRCPNCGYKESCCF